MTKTLVKFQKNQYKTVGGQLRPQGIPCPFTLLKIMPEKWLSSTFKKSNKKKSEDYIQTTCISSDHDQNNSEVSKESV